MVNLGNIQGVPLDHEDVREEEAQHGNETPITRKIHE